jgi:hypothetical protein
LCGLLALERIVTQVERPTKQRLREYLYRRQRSSEPPPTPEQARRELGWNLTPKPKNR